MLKRPVVGSVPYRRSDSVGHQAIKFAVILFFLGLLVVFATYFPHHVAPPPKNQPHITESFILGSSSLTLTHANLKDSDDETCKGRDEFNTTDQYCAYLEDHCDDAQINYMHVYYCTGFSPIGYWAILLIEVLILFYMLAKAADSYFCPVLELIADKLQMSDEVAGLTILALGNGSPDVASTFSAIRQNNFNIAIGELFGAGFFVTSVVVGLVAMVSDAEVNTSFLKDNIFLLLSVCAIALLVHFENITLWQSCLLLVFYFAYIIISLVIHYVGLWMEKKKNSEDPSFMRGYNIQAPAERELDETHRTSLLESVTNLDDLGEGIDYVTLATWKEKWDGKTTPQKIIYVGLMPLWLPLHITTPNVAIWNRFINSITPITSPLVVFLAFQLFDRTFRVSDIDFPVSGLCMLIGLVFAIIFFFTSKWDEPPIYFPLYCIVAFGISMAWIYLIASELVAVLQAIGLILGISDVILGATVLAWGNSVGDLVADVVMARHGAPRMAIAACYGGPCFNIMFGLGLSLTYSTIVNFPDPYRVAATHLYYLTAAFFVVGLTLSLVVIAMVTKFVIVKGFGIFLIIAYLAYCVLAALISAGVLWPETT